MLKEVDDLALLFDIPEKDDQLVVVRLRAKEADGQAKTLAKLQRSGENRARHLLGLIDRNGNLHHEIRRLEEALRWIYGTEQPLAEIRRVIEKTVPRTIRRQRAPRPPRSLRVSVEPDDVDGGFAASIAEIPGCTSQGETQAEALSSLAEALADVLDLS